LKKGKDGKMWQVRKTKTGVKRWVRIISKNYTIVGKTTENTIKTVQLRDATRQFATEVMSDFKKKFPKIKYTLRENK
jgi:hypothetical protein